MQHFSHQRANRAGRDCFGQSPDPSPAHTAEAGDRDRDGAGEPVPAKRAKRARAGMARGGEGRAEEDQIDPGACSAHELHPIVRRGGEQARAPADHRQPATAEMKAGAERGSETRIARDHQSKAPGAAEAGKIASERPPLRRAVMAQHDSGEPDGQASNGGARVGKAGFVGEEPERGKSRTARLDRVRPGDELGIHARRNSRTPRHP